MENWNIPLTPRAKIGYSGENAVTELEIITTPEEGFIYYLETEDIEENANNILLTPDYVESRIYVLLTTEMLGKGGILQAQVVAYIDTEDEPVKKSNIFQLQVNPSINATKDVESHYQTALSQWAQILASFNPVEILNEIAEMEAQLDNKQNKLTAGYGMTLNDPTDEISVDTEEIATKNYVISKQPTDTAKGNAITLTDSTDEPIKAISIMGKSTQNGTPSIDNPIPIVDVTSEQITVTDGTETQTAELDIVLRGIPVSSGGNYTDNNGQQWICDTIERYADGTGKLIRRVYHKVFNGTENWVYQDNQTYQRLYVALESGVLDSRANNPRSMLNLLPLGATDTNNYNQYLVAGSNLYLNPSTNGTACMTKAEWQSFLASNNMTVIACLNEPTETPLTAEQLAELELDTYYPTTNINSNADVIVEYVCDTKNYIDKKTSALTSAILSLGGNI